VSVDYESVCREENLGPTEGQQIPQVCFYVISPHSCDASRTMRTVVVNSFVSYADIKLKLLKRRLKQ